MFHVTILYKEKLPTRHLDRNEAKLSVVERSHTFACIQANVNVSKIHQLRKYKQAKLGLYSLHLLFCSGLNDV